MGKIFSKEDEVPFTEIPETPPEPEPESTEEFLDALVLVKDNARV